MLLHGAGDNAASWLPVRRGLAPVAEVLAYDRAGIGTNAHRPDRPRTLERYLAELDTFLAGAAPPSPVVLVGHSLGGLIAAACTHRNPDAVAGLVLVDATPVQAGADRAVAAGFVVSGLVARLLRAGTHVGLTQALVRCELMPGYPEQRRLRAHLTAAEQRGWRSLVARSFRNGAADELASVPAAARCLGRVLTSTGQQPPLGDVPLAVVSSCAYGAAWESWQEELARSSRWHVHLRTGDRSHNIHLSHPDVVVDAVRHVMAEARRRQAGGVTPVELR